MFILFLITLYCNKINLVALNFDFITEEFKIGN